MKDTLYNISSVISKKIFKSIYLNVQKTQNIQWLEKMSHFDKQIQGILQRNVYMNIYIYIYLNQIKIQFKLYINKCLNIYI